MSSPDLLPLTDCFWLAAHDTGSGKSCLASGPLGIGLATGLLAELLYTGIVSIQDEQLYLQFSPPPTDVALASVARLLADEERMLRSRPNELHQQIGLNLREWIRFLAIENRAADLVTMRLTQSGSITVEHRRKLLGGATSRFVPRDTYVSGVPANRVLTSLERQETLDAKSLVLAGLLLATGLHQEALNTLSSDGRAELARQLRALHPMPRELLRCAEQLVGETVMNR